MVDVGVVGGMCEEEYDVDGVIVMRIGERRGCGWISGCLMVVVVVC